MHTHFLKEALDLARQRKGFCAPNPAVGAVIVKNSQILASGYHYGAGYPHAEIEAIKLLDSRQSQCAALYVTLEPCCHQGKTPPCTAAILQSGISHVYYGLKDPDPRVSGQGIAELERAGVICTHIPLQEIDDFYLSYCYWQVHQKPYVTAKLAISKDQKIAGTHGKAVKISGSHADIFTRQQRKLADALLTSAKTIKNDDPRLNVRLEQQVFKKSVYVLDRTLSMPKTACIFKTAAQVILFHGDDVHPSRTLAYTNQGAICIPTPQNESQQLSWDFIVNEIGRQGVHDLWVEAGACCFASLLLGNYVQQVYLYFSLDRSIGADGIDAFSGRKDLFKHVKKAESQTLGKDFVCRFILH